MAFEFGMYDLGLKFYGGETKGAAHRWNAAQPLTKVCEQPRCQDEVSRRQGGFDELSRRSTGRLRIKAIKSLPLNQRCFEGKCPRTLDEA